MSTLVFIFCDLCKEENMKIKVRELPYEDVMKINVKNHKLPTKQSKLARWILKTASKGEVKAVDFFCKEIGMEKLGKDEPALFLMNHSSFTDLCIASEMLKNRQYHIITTNDGFIGKEALMRWIGCIPTRKFVADMTLVKDMQYTFSKLNSSILMFPEASYSFDGSATPLPESLGKFVKIMKTPVVMIFTEGAYLRDPLYNNLQKRKAEVTSTMKYLLSPEDIKNMSAQDINKILADAFTYDHFRSQHEKGIIINEGFRADGLNRPLYKCPLCGTEGKMEGKGTTIKCHYCSSEIELAEDGTLTPKYLHLPGRCEWDFPHKYVTDWYAWERACVAEEIGRGEYSMDMEVDILMLADLKSMYKVGDGRLVHNSEGFTLTGCDGKLEYRQKPQASYGLYSDYFWYEIGDMISVGDTSHQYYCFPKDQKGAIVAKARLATEEMYKLSKGHRQDGDKH